jgi:hypothetical protein
MPGTINIKGVQPLAWGTETVAGYVTESSTRDVSTEEFTIKDEQGRIITQITGHGVKTEYTFEYIPKSATAVPAMGDVLTAGAEKMVLLSLSRKRIQDGPEKWSIKAVAYPEITLP